MADYRIAQGLDYNYFKLVSVSNTTFGSPTDGYTPDVNILFPTPMLSVSIYGLISSYSIKYSFPGFSTHGDLVPGTQSPAFLFNNRPVRKICFKIKKGSNGQEHLRRKPYIYIWRETISWRAKCCI